MVESITESLNNIQATLQNLSITQNSFDWTSLITAVAMVVTAIVAYLSSRAAQKAAQETELARKSEFLPVIAMYVEAISENVIKLTLVNVGRDLARNIRVFKPRTSPVVAVEYSLGNLIKGAQQKVTIGGWNINTLLALPKEERKLVVLYRDLFGRIITSEAFLVRETEDTTHSRYNHIAISAWKIIIPEDRPKKRK